MVLVVVLGAVVVVVIVDDVLVVAVVVVEEVVNWLTRRGWSRFFLEDGHGGDGWDGMGMGVRSG